MHAFRIRNAMVWPELAFFADCRRCREWQRRDLQESDGFCSIAMAGKESKKMHIGCGPIELIALLTAG